MFSKKGGKPRQKAAGAQRPGADLANMMGFGAQMEPDDDESDLLAELAALEGRPVAKKKPTAQNKVQLSMADIDKMAAESMKDIDDDADDDDEFDENDLLGELDELMADDDDEDMKTEEPPARMQPTPQAQPAPPPQTHSPAPSNDMQTVLTDRKSMYLQAIENAKSEGSSSKVRRFQRGLKDIEGLIKKVQRGGAINEDDIPPQVAIKGSTSGASAPPASAPPASAPPASAPLTSAPPTSAPPTSAPPTSAPPPIPPHASPPPVFARPTVAEVNPPETEVLIPGLPAPPLPTISHEPALQPVATPAHSSVNTPHVSPVAQAPSITSESNTTVDSEKLNILLTRQKEFKMAALKMKQAGNMAMAKKSFALSKVFDTLIEDVKAGKDVDISNIPKLPSVTESIPANPPEMTHTPSEPQQSPMMQPSENEQPAGSSSSPAGEGAESSGPPPAPQTVMEALQQRLAKYQSAEQEAKQQGNGGKARRMGRIVRQYQDAIKCYKAKKPIDYNDLPCPPGYGPFPGVEPPPDSAHDVPIPVSAPAAVTPAPTAPNVVGPSIAAEPHASPGPPTATPVIKPSRNQKEYEFLVNRQKEFKRLALQAKKAEDVESAREYLKIAKGIDPMIAAAENGLRVDVTQVPALPSKDKANTQSPKNSSNTPNSIKKAVEFDGNTAQQYAQVENALQKQIETSQKNLEHYKLLGNLDAAKNFQSLYQSSKKDLDTLLAYKKQGSPVPKCQTVVKTFPVIRSNPHLSDSELEIIIVRCTNIPLPSGWAPKDMYTYVTFELPYPQEKPQIGNTTTKKETINPEFNESFKFLIERKNRTFGRYCKRNGINMKVNYVRGFLKGDKALGQATIKFEHFNNRCEIHECVDLVDLEKGRKAVGGKIEVKLKIREPLVDKDAEIIKENWLVLDTHLRGLDMSTSQQTANAPAVASSGFESMEVLRFEKEMCEKKMHAYKNQGKHPPAALTDSIKSYQQKIHFIQTKMKDGGRPAVNEYLVALTNGLERQRILAQDALKKNDKEAAKLCLTKKKLIEKEVGVLKQRLGF